MTNLLSPLLSARAFKFLKSEAGFEVFGAGWAHEDKGRQRRGILHFTYSEDLDLPSVDL
jgi:hypothetical protein